MSTLDLLRSNLWPLLIATSFSTDVERLAPSFLQLLPGSSSCGYIPPYPPPHLAGYSPGGVPRQPSTPLLVIRTNNFT